MTTILDWNSNRDMWIRVLSAQSDIGLAKWNSTIQALKPENEESLRRWLKTKGISGYAENLLVMEYFGYPDFLNATASELIDAQYADRQHLRPIYDAIIQTVSTFGKITIQTRKSYISLLTPKRTFARIKPSTKKRVDVGLRLKEQNPGGRLKPCNFQETMKVQFSLISLEELDSEAVDYLRAAYKFNS